jgi:hypothetical protein
LLPDKVAAGRTLTAYEPQLEGLALANEFLLLSISDALQNEDVTPCLPDYQRDDLETIEPQQNVGKCSDAPIMFAVISSGHVVRYWLEQSLCACSQDEVHNAAAGEGQNQAR